MTQAGTLVDGPYEFGGAKDFDLIDFHKDLSDLAALAGTSLPAIAADLPWVGYAGNPDQLEIRTPTFFGYGLGADATFAIDLHLNAHVKFDLGDLSGMAAVTLTEPALSEVFGTYYLDTTERLPSIMLASSLPTSLDTINVHASGGLQAGLKAAGVYEDGHPTDLTTNAAFIDKTFDQDIFHYDIAPGAVAFSQTEGPIQGFFAAPVLPSQTLVATGFDSASTSGTGPNFAEVKLDVPELIPVVQEVNSNVVDFDSELVDIGVKYKVVTADLGLNLSLQQTLTARITGVDVKVVVSERNDEQELAPDKPVDAYVDLTPVTGAYGDTLKLSFTPGDRYETRITESYTVHAVVHSDIALALGGQLDLGLLNLDAFINPIFIDEIDKSLDLVPSTRFNYTLTAVDLAHSDFSIDFTPVDIVHYVTTHTPFVGDDGPNVLTLPDGQIDYDGFGGNDFVTGNETPDYITGGTGDDNLVGRGGNDYLRGDDGNDILFGGAGDDTLLTGAGAPGGGDVAFGGDGDDHIYAQAGTATIDGGSGQDVVVVTLNPAGGQTFDGGSGFDLLALDASSFTQGVALRVDDADADGNVTVIEGDTPTVYRNFEAFTFKGGAGNDVITGSDTPSPAYGEPMYGNADIFHGGDGDDTLDGRIGADSLYGDEGNDILYGGDGKDYLTGGAGNDREYGNDGDDSLHGDGGNDELNGGKGDDTLDGGDGIDILSGGDGSDIIHGGDGNDVLQADAATPGDPDVFDELHGDTGNDTLIGGSGSALLNGGEGDDTIVGGTGAGVLVGGTGSDRIEIDASTGLVAIYGNAGSDHAPDDGAIDILQIDGDVGLLPGDGSYATFADLPSAPTVLTSDGSLANGSSWHGIDAFDVTTGDAAAYIVGSGGNDVLSGGAGDDYLDGGAGADKLSGGGGDDMLVGALGDAFDGGSGADTVLFDAGRATAGIRLALGDSSYGSVEGGLGLSSSFAHVERIQMINGSAFDDNLSGGQSNDSLLGGGGVDYIAGNDGNDFIDPGAGRDIAHGGAGNDVISGVDFGPIDPTATVGEQYYGDAGNDTITATGTASLVDGGSGDDFLIVMDGAAGGNFTRVIDGGAGSDTLIGSGADETFIGGIDPIDARPTALDNPRVTLDPAILDGNDVVHAAGGNDIVYGGAGDDMLYGDAGDDVIRGGSGNDTILGGPGNDNLDGGSGDDILNAGGVDFVGGSGPISTLPGGAPAPVAAGDNILNGGAGNDTLLGGNGADTLNGGSGNDRIFADGKDDVDGGAGIDTLNLDLSAAVAGVTLDLSQAFAGGTSTLNGHSITGVEQYGQLIGSNFADTITVGDPTQGHDGEIAYDGNPGVFGGGGNDTLIGGAATNYLFGGDGNDILKGMGGNDYLEAGTGTDTLDGGDGSDYAYLNFGGSSDIVLINGGVANVVYTATIGGVAGTSITNIEAMGLIGGSGNDILGARFADVGSSSFYGGTGTDLLVVDFSASAVSAVMDVDAGSITSTNGPSLGTILYQDFERLDYTAGSGGGTITGFEGGDILRGGAGADIFSGRAGDDLISGGLGNDILDGGDGIDTVSYADAAAAVRISLAITTIQQTVSAGKDIVTGFENLTGSSFGDLLTGDAGANLIRGGAGNDTITGGDGDDVLMGGAGNDILAGGNGIDTASYDDAASGVVVSLAITTVQKTIGSGKDALTGIENLDGSHFDDTLSGDDGANAIHGGAGNDIVAGGLGDDILDGGTGTDTLSYGDATSAVIVSLALLTAQNTIGAGVDTVSGFENLLGSAFADHLTGDVLANHIDGGVGDDVIAAGGGDDVVSGGGGNDVLDGGDGVDTLSYADTISSVMVSLGMAGPQNTGGGGTDTITGFEKLIGSQAADTLRGDDLANLIHGGNANDVLFGGGGNDQLFGDNGADRIDGGAGQDILTGGNNGDRFILASASDSAVGAGDIITDFQHAETDKIDLSAAFAGKFSFLGSHDFTGHAGQLDYHVVGSDLLVAGDIDGDGHADFEIKLLGIQTLEAADFIL